MRSHQLLNPRVADATRPLGLVARAQIHTHPGFFVDHSFYDNENVLIPKAIDAFHNAASRPDFLRQGDHGKKWQRLADADAEGCFAFHAREINVLDLR